MKIYHLEYEYYNIKMNYGGLYPHSNQVTSSKLVDTLICHTTMRRNPINFIYNSGHVTL